MFCNLNTNLFCIRIFSKQYFTVLILSFFHLILFSFLSFLNPFITNIFYVLFITFRIWKLAEWLNYWNCFWKRNLTLKKYGHRSRPFDVTPAKFAPSRMTSQQLRPFLHWVGGKHPPLVLKGLMTSHRAYTTKINLFVQTLLLFLMLLHKN